MSYRSLIDRLAVLLGVFLATEGLASATVVSVPLQLVSGGGYNQFSLTPGWRRSGRTEPS